MIKLCIFDWNGTLLDDLRIAYKSTVEIFKHYGLLPPTLEQFRQEISADFMQFYYSYGIPKTATKEDLNKIRERVLTENFKFVSLEIGALQLLKECRLQGLTLAIVSAEIPSVLILRLQQFNITKYFARVRGGAWPKGPAFIEMLQALGVKPNEAVYVDDTFDGIRAAKKAGLFTIGFTNGYNSTDRIHNAMPDFYTDTLANIIPIIAKLNERK